MSEFAVFCGPEPYNGRRTQITNPNHAIVNPHPEKIPLSELSDRDGITWSYPYDEGDELPPGYDPLVTVSFSLRTWRWDGTRDEHGDYRFRAEEDV